MNVGVVIAAAGSGRRMGSAGNKVLLPLDGKPILAYSLQLFAAFDVVSEIIVVTREMDLEVVDQLIDALGLGSIARTILVKICHTIWNSSASSKIDLMSRKTGLQKENRILLK